jgi:hypothetical protein
LELCHKLSTKFNSALDDSETSNKRIMLFRKKKAGRGGKYEIKVTEVANAVESLDDSA